MTVRAKIKGAVAGLVAASVVSCAGDGTGLDENGNPLVPGGVTISVSRLSLPVGGSTMLSATVDDIEGNPVLDPTVTWSSSNESVVTVDDTGLATGVGAGDAVVTATTQEGAEGQVVAAIVASADFAADVQPIFSGNCAFSQCHASPATQEGLNLSAGVAYANIVGVAAQQLATMSRIEPGNADLSYLVNKLQGTQVAVGGSGSQMPLGAGQLDQADIETIRAWAQAGALNN